MVMLGQLLARATDTAAALPTDLVEAIASTGTPPDAFARQAVRRFERQAQAQDWALLMTRVRDAADPGSACLEAMVRWSLAHTHLPTGASRHDPSPR